LLRRTIEVEFCRLLEQNLASLQKADQLIADMNRYSRVGKSGKTGHGAGTVSDFLGEFALHFKASGTSAVRPCHQFAKSIFVRRAVQRHRPMCHRGKRERHASRVAKCADVIAINGRAGEFFDKLLVAELHESQAYPDAIRCRKFTATRCSRF
jgi:hypothetical protein